MSSSLPRPRYAGAAAPTDYAAARLTRRLPAVRTRGPITIDGLLEDEDWSRAPVATGFIQSEPREGAPASDNTEVRILYDDDNLYIGVFAEDAEPSRIITNELKRDFDRTASDSFELVLDTFHDERNAYHFATNAAGAKWDAQSVNEGREVNANWDGVWTVQTRVTANGWYAEIAIPFRTLRCPSLDVQTWGMNFLRRVRRRNEDSTWAPLPRMYILNRVSLAGTLEGLQGVQTGSDLRVKPYALTSDGATRGRRAAGDFEGGLDVKYGVTTGLTWDFTVNTDFSQVEADEQQINLTRVSLLFPEKRDFFLENSGIFQFGPAPAPATGGRQNAGGADLLLFFSRRVGLSPEGATIPILAGTRLTGRAGGFLVGALNIQQRGRDASPAANVTAFRLRHDVLANSDVGVLFLNRAEHGGRFNRVVGADGNFRFFRDLNLGMFGATTRSPNTPAGVGGDSTARASMTYRTSLWDLRASYLTIGEHFNDELGFVPRKGIHKTDGYFGPHLRPKKTSGWLREYVPHWHFSDIERIGRGTESRYSDYHVSFSLQNSTFIEAGANQSREVLFEPFKINSRRGVAIDPGQYDYTEWFAIWRTNAAAPFSMIGRWAIGTFYDGDKHNYELGGTMKVKSRFTGSLNVAYNRIDLRAGQYSTNLVTSRMIYSFSTRMFLNALLQYNTDAREWSSNVRFNVIHRPLSDFYLVYNERRDSRTNEFLDRAVVAKITYMVAF